MTYGQNAPSCDPLNNQIPNTATQIQQKIWSTPLYTRDW